MGNPWGEAGKYTGNESDPGGMQYQAPKAGNLTNQALIEQLDSALAAPLKAEANPAAPTPEQEFAARQARDQAMAEQRLRSMQHAHQSRGF